MRNLITYRSDLLNIFKINLFNRRNITSIRCLSVSLEKDRQLLKNLSFVQNYFNSRNYCIPKIDHIGNALIDLVTFETVCSDTLESLCEYFDDIIESTPHLKFSDVTFGDGVLNVNFGNESGIYVINRQTPNRQIWLSSPMSGPKRFDFIPNSENSSGGYWFYKHEMITLHELLQKEIGIITKKDVNFYSLPYSKKI